MARRKSNSKHIPTTGWAVYLRTSSDENQKPEFSRARQRYAIEKNVLDRSEMSVYAEYIDILTGMTTERKAYQQLLNDARAGKFSHVIVERADRFGRNDTEALRAIDELHEFGVAVRFANQPDLNPMDPDDRVIVALTFTLARRESALLGLRVRGGVKAKRDSGGFHGVAPDGYINMTGTDIKKVNGRYQNWIEPDPERAPIVRLSWDLLLEGRYSLTQICELLHQRGHRYRSGRPYIVVTDSGKHKANYNSLSNMFHNWTYAGWVTSKKNNVPPKTIRGNWEPLVTTEEFERGLAILDKRNRKRTPHRKHDYLLSGMVYYRETDPSSDIKLTGSTVNASRPNGGTSYYRIAGRRVRFLCKHIEAQIPLALSSIQVDPQFIPAIRAVYTNDIAIKMGVIRPDERKEVQAALQAVDDEEARAVRLFAAGKITEKIWESLWREWQDRRNQLRLTLDSLQERSQQHVENLDLALQVITYAGIVYNDLSRDDQRDLLRQMVERVVVDPNGNVSLDLRTPFAYLHDVSDDIRASSQISEELPHNKKTAHFHGGLGKTECSIHVLLCGESCSINEHSPTPQQLYFQSIAYPHRAEAARFSISS